MRYNQNINLVLLILKENTREVLQSLKAKTIISSVMSDSLLHSLYSAMKEVNLFYTQAFDKPNFNIYYISDEISDHFRNHLELFDSQIITVENSVLDDALEISRAIGRKYDARKIMNIIKSIITESQNGYNVVITNLELSPPYNYRYILWSNRVISIIPMDPLYWGMDEPERLSIIKHRIRTATLSVVGAILGIGGCNNEYCFRYRNIDSVTRLDYMMMLGPEHRIQSLSGLGFDYFSENPSQVQPIVQDPLERRWAKYE